MGTPSSLSLRCRWPCIFSFKWCLCERKRTGLLADRWLHRTGSLHGFEVCLMGTTLCSNQLQHKCARWLFNFLGEVSAPPRPVCVWERTASLAGWTVNTKVAYRGSYGGWGGRGSFRRDTNPAAPWASRILLCDSTALCNANRNIVIQPRRLYSVKSKKHATMTELLTSFLLLFYFICKIGFYAKCGHYLLIISATVAVSVLFFNWLVACT